MIWTHRNRIWKPRNFGAFEKGRRIVFAVGMTMLCVTAPCFAQDWGSEPDDDWETDRPARRSPSSYRSGGTDRYDEGLSGWSVRAGVGFTSDPETLLLNFELPYAFDRWVSAGPMLQVGIDTHDTIVAPTMNVTVKIPDLPGQSLDRLHPYAMVGLGFAVIADDNRQNDNVSAGFLINFGIGIEYQVSPHLYLGSQMMFNFLPEETLDEDFFYSWQVGGARIAF